MKGCDFSSLPPTQSQKQNTTMTMTESKGSSTGASPSTSSSSLVCGETRIRDVDGFCGTVVYVGPVASAKKQNEVYAGIVWDDPSRGKHDGSVICRQTNKLVKHFPCPCGPTQGSFLKLSKLDSGVALTIELLQSKYVEMQAPVIAPNNVLPHSARTSSGKDKPIELLGELKIRKRQQLDDIDKISLRNERISKASASLSLETTTSTPSSKYHRIRHIDLAGNLLCNWKEVIEIMKQFPLLEEFSVAFNRIRDIHKGDDDGLLPTGTPPPAPPLHEDFSKLKVLNLNNCSIKDFRTIQWIESSMTNLEALCIASSDLSNMTLLDETTKEVTTSSTTAPDAAAAAGETTRGFQKLKNLDCSNCNLSSWKEQISKHFGSLPLVEQLSLDDNALLSSISTDDVDPDSFPNLKSIQLAGTNITTWSDIEGLNSLRQVSSLRLKNTPLTSTMGQGEVRFLAVARCPRLEYFNASFVSTQERTEAERRYISLVVNLQRQKKQQEEEQTGVGGSNGNSGHDGKGNDGKDDKSEPTADIVNNNIGNSNDGGKDGNETHPSSLFYTDHPQFERLRTKHKDLIIFNSSDAGVGGAGMNLQSSVCNVTIQSLAPSSCHMEPMIRRLPGTLTVGRLKSLCARTFQLDVDLMTLHFRTETDAFPIELDNDENTLNYYGICDGAEIIMNEVNVDTQQMELQRKQLEYEQKIRQQENEISTIQKLKQRQQQ